MVLDALGGILGEAVGVLVSPLPIVAVILMLFSPRALTNGLAALIGWIGGLTAVGAIVLVVADAADVSTDAGARDGSGGVHVALGVVLIVLAVRQWRRRPRRRGETPTPPKWMARVDNLSPAGALVLGVLLAAANPKNLILTVSAATSVGQAGLDTAGTVVTWALFVVVASLGVTAPVAYRVARPQHAPATLGAWRNWLEANSAPVMAVVLLVIGAKILGDGLATLS